jgi:serine protease Do
MAFSKGLGLLRGAAIAVIVCAAPAAAIVPATSRPALADGPASVADLAQGLIEAVVNISTSQTVKGNESDGGDGSDSVPAPQEPDGSPFQEFFKDFFGNQGQAQDAPSHEVQSLGSGFIIDAQRGLVVTNNHVISDADDIEVNFNDGAKLKATIVGIDTKTDLAVLKIDPKAHKLTDVKFGDSDRMRIGDWVMAIGNPFGLGGTVTTGIVSARNRDINSGPYDNFIQTDAAINRGNSGGPLFNEKGEVIGINTAIISPTGGSIGIGFAIPSNLAKGVIDQLVQYKEVRRGWLGVRIEPVTDEIAKTLGIAEPKGALVAGVVKGGPVDNGSIEPGDVIVSFDGQPVGEAHDLPRMVAESEVGKEVDIVLVRKGKELTVKVKLGRLDDSDKLAANTSPPAHDKGSGNAAHAQTPANLLGMTLGALDDQARARFGIAGTVTGVLVTAVDPSSPAADRHVQPGDVIVQVDQESVKTPEDVARHIDALRKSGRKAALLMLASKTGDLHPVTVLID